MSTPAAAQPPALSMNSREIQDAPKQPRLSYAELPNATSIRLLNIVEAIPGKVRCEIRVVDLDDEPEYAALSYTWGNPITIYEEPMPDLDQWKYPEEADKFPFTFSTPPLGPDGEALVSVDGATRDYLSFNPNIPYEKVDWNKGTPRSIEVNGREVSIEENLFLYLVAIGQWRGQYAKEDTASHVNKSLCLPIWIDAICINQSDLYERAAQVQLMGRIFKSTSIVFAWIGVSDKLLDLAFEAAKIILNYEATRSEAIWASTANSDTDRPQPMEMSLSSIPGMNIVFWFSLFSLFQRLYFRRAWIAQELIFAKDIIVICSGNILGMDLLLTVFSFIVENGLDHDLCRLGRSLLTIEPISESGLYIRGLSYFKESQQYPEEDPPGTELDIEPRNAFSFVLGYHRVRGRLGLSNAGMPLIRNGLQPSESNQGNVHNWRVEIPESIHLSDHIIEEVEEDGLEGFRFHRRPLRLLSILSDFRNLDATDSRDKIFAFLNLATDDLGLVPDYHLNVQDVFRNATEVMMGKTGTLSILSHIQEISDVQVKELPGWVPDFSVRLDRAPFDQGGEECYFRASRMQTASLHINFDGTLRVHGFRIDTISSTTDIAGPPVIEVLKLALKVPVQYLGEPLSWWSKNHGTGGRRELHPRAVTRLEALWRTLIADQLTELDEDYGGLDSRDSLSSGFIAWVLTDILEARSLLVEYIDIDPLSWMGKLIHRSFNTRMALWSEIYDGVQSSSFTNDRDLTDVVRGLSSKKQEEEDQYLLDQHLETPSPTMGIEHFPTAHQISNCFQKKVEEPDDNEQDPILGVYKMSALLRLTPLERRQLRNFEKGMRKYTDGRRIFSTEAGRLGLGPMSTGQDSGCIDEVWILNGAKVPFILRRVIDNRYQIVGEAYVHGDIQEICLL